MKCSNPHCNYEAEFHPVQLEVVIHKNNEPKQGWLFDYCSEDCADSEYNSLQRVHSKDSSNRRVEFNLTINS